jgi:hypothetical protein
VDKGLDPAWPLCIGSLDPDLNADRFADKRHLQRQEALAPIYQGPRGQPGLL